MYRGYKELLVEQQGKFVVAKFNDPVKKNALNINAYKEITQLLNVVSNDAEVTIIVFTGVGDFFTSGNNLKMTSFDPKESNDIFKSMITAFISCSKVIVSIVNGPSIGIGTTIVGLSDVAWCAEHTYFLTPFTKLGLVPEGCSSYVLPHTVGRSKACEMLLLNEPMSAKEALQFNFVSRIFKLEELDAIVWPKVRQWAELPAGALEATKKLLRLHERENLVNTNQAEAEELYKRIFTEEFAQAILDFASRKTKSKL